MNVTPCRLPRSLLLLTTMVLLSVTTSVHAENLTENLTAELQKLAQASQTKTPPERAAIMQKSLEDLRSSKILDTAPQVGQKLPDATFLDVNGAPTKLYQTIGNNPAIITLYRGGWCPYCNLQLNAYAAHLDEIESLGAKLIAMSPEIPEQTLSTKQKNELKFTVLSDSNNQYARELNLIFDLDPALQGVYKEFGIDLEKNQGNKAWQLPLAATFVIDPARVIRYAFVDIDYKKRADPAVVIAKLREIKG